MTDQRPLPSRPSTPWWVQLWALALLGATTAALIGYAFGYRTSGYAPLPIEIYWASAWFLLAAGYVFDRIAPTAALVSASFLIGALVAHRLAADPYAIWGLRALFLLLALFSAPLAWAASGSGPKSVR